MSAFASDEGRILVFNLGSERFGIPLLRVREVIALPEFTPVPQTQKYVCGLMNLRGQILSAIDLRVRLGFSGAKAEENCVVIVDVGEFPIGMVVDAVDSVQSMPVGKELTRPEVGGTRLGEWVKGVIEVDQKLVLLLELGKLLGVDEQKALVGAAQKASEKVA